MHKLQVFIAMISVLSLLFIAGCKEEPSPREGYNYNAFFVYPMEEDQEEPKIVYVGTVKGLSSCKYIVSNYYAKRRKYISKDWDYICCHKTEDDECAAKHTYGDN